MASLVGFGKTWNQVKRLPTFEHDIFFNFLLVSPSYALAHKYRNKKKISKADLPADFKKVQSTYNLIGNIYNTTFEEWWQAGGYKLFDYEDNVRNITINVDLSKPEEESLRKVISTIKNAYRLKREKRDNKRIKFLKNKINLPSLVDRKNFVIMKALGNRAFKRELEHWRVAIGARLHSKWTEGLQINSKVTLENLRARTALGELSSKLLKDAWYLSENAARLEFPSYKQNPNAIPINFKHLSEVMFKYTELEGKLLEKYKDKPDLLIRDKYTLSAVRQYRKKKILNTKIKSAVKTAVSEALEKQKEEQAKLARRHFASSRR